MYRVPERLYRTVTGRLVRHGHPEAAFLAFPAGMELSDEEATRTGVLQYAVGESMREKPMDKGADRTTDKGNVPGVVAPPVEPVPATHVEVVGEGVGPVGSATAVEPKPVVVADSVPEPAVAPPVTPTVVSEPSASRRAGTRTRGSRYTR